MSRALPNPLVGITYIPDNTRMETPPAFFLQRLFDYDADLVLLPSRMRPFAYVIARRRRFSAGLTDAAIESTITNSDTLMCMKYGLVPVSMMFKHGTSWNADSILARLQARDLWAAGGADAACDALEAQEAAEKAAEQKAIRDDMWNRSGDAWRSYKFRTGQAVGMALGAQSGRRIPNSPTTSGSTAGSGALFVGRE